jgi:hypothetical protein
MLGPAYLCSQDYIHMYVCKAMNTAPRRQGVYIQYMYVHNLSELHICREIESRQGEVWRLLNKNINLPR